jgi:hypothetical protein
MASRIATLLFLDNDDISRSGRLGSMLWSDEKNVKVIFKDNSTKDFKSIHDYSIGFDSNKEFYNPYWLQRWADETKLEDGRTVKQALIFKGQTLWYLYEYLLSADVDVVPFVPSSRVLYYIDVINEILKKEKPVEVMIQNDKDILYRIISEVCKQKSIRVRSLGISGKKAFKQRMRENIPLLRCYLKTKICMRSMVGLLAGRKNKRSSKDNKKLNVLLLSNERFCKGPNETNVFWDTIAKELSKNKIDFDVLEYDVLWDSHALVKMLKRHVPQKYPHTLYIGSYYDMNVFREIRRVASFSRKTWKQFRKSNKFTQSLNYKGINIFPYLEKRFALVFKAFSQLAGDSLAVSEAVIKSGQPKMVVLDHENNFYGLGFLMNSKNYDFKTISLQFESVNLRTSVHRHIPSEKAFDKKSPVWRPLADMKCASGPYAKEILVNNCNFRPETIEITGQPRYDNLAQKKLTESLKQLYSELGLDASKKTIVYASKFNDDEAQIWAYLKDMVRKRDDIQLVFKLAPVNNLKFYKEKIGEEKNVVVSKDIDLVKLLNVSDLLITKRSTVAMEAMCLEKPVLLVDFYKTNQFPYIELGAAYDLKSLEELEQGVDRCLYDEKVKKSLALGGKKFIASYLYKQDGKAAERVVSIIKREMKK